MDTLQPLIKSAQVIMEKSPVSIAILLACHNRIDKTLNCLKNITSQQHQSNHFVTEIFLVDDASSDGTAEAVVKQFPEVNIIKGDGKLFWCRGMHLAWKTASHQKKFDFYLWANDDVNIFPNAISVMLDSYFNSGKNAVICGATKSEITEKYTYGGQKKDGTKVIPDGTLQECTIMNGNFVLISDSIFQKVGIIDNIFHHAIGDHDYGLRTIKAGFRILIAPDYIGYCEAHEKLPTWCLKNVPFRKRIKSLYSPLGNSHPYYFFVYEKRHFGLPVAIKHFFSIHLRVLLPGLWK